MENVPYTDEMRVWVRFYALDSAMAWRHYYSLSAFQIAYAYEFFLSCAELPNIKLCVAYSILFCWAHNCTRYYYYYDRVHTYTDAHACTEHAEYGRGRALHTPNIQGTGNIYSKHRWLYWLMITHVYLVPTCVCVCMCTVHTFHIISPYIRNS